MRVDSAQRNRFCTWASGWRLKVLIVCLHILLAGGVFVVYPRLIQETQLRPWYTILYLVLLMLTISQYFCIIFSSPGYVVDVMKDKLSAEAVTTPTDVISSALSRMGPTTTLNINEEGRALLKNIGLPHSPDANQFTELSNSDWKCSSCNMWKPLRSKHCYECGKCVLGFDHHCLWLGKCIGERNHCQFWWYLAEETTLGIWTTVMYIQSFIEHGPGRWWHILLATLLLGILFICLMFSSALLIFHCYLVLTNQTTYEFGRRRRISYLRNVPDYVHPFSRGWVRNIYSFCCLRNDFYAIHSLPPIEELEARARPYTYWDVLSCRCC